MTMSNNDMVALFADVIMCMEIPSLEIKKMCVAWRRRSRLSGCNGGVTLTWTQVLPLPRQLRSDEAGYCFESAPDSGAGMILRSRTSFSWSWLNTVLQDLGDSNPLMRALALRTLSYVHVRQFVEATIEPLKVLLQDSDPYVRKTAAFTVAKVYDHDKNLVERSDLIDRLNMMLRDENPTVVSSALAALMDIWERSESIKLTIDYASASKIVQILPDCSE
jgi:hypothetical protein